MADALSLKDYLVGEREIKSKEVYVELSITGNATPASKAHATDYPSTAYLRTEGKVAEADAIEDLSADFTTAVDNSTGDSQFGIVLDASKLGDIDKVMDVELYEDKAGSALATSIAISPAISGSWVTSAGNIAVDVAGTGLNLASESPKMYLKVSYRLK